jgi:hypothetical protein
MLVGVRGVRHVRYEFVIAGSVSVTVQAAFPELTTTKSPGGGTAMYGAVDDAARLRELLARFDDLGVEVVEMRRLPD